jgi:hypothetical protein
MISVVYNSFQAVCLLYITDYYRILHFITVNKPQFTVLNMRWTIPK